MKRLHKILMGGAVALALAVAFAGCKNANDTVGNAAVVDSIAYIASKNSTTSFVCIFLPNFCLLFLLTLHL